MGIRHGGVQPIRFPTRPGERSLFLWRVCILALRPPTRPFVFYRRPTHLFDQNRSSTPSSDFFAVARASVGDERPGAV